MPDAITASPPPASPAIDKSPSIKRESADSGDSQQKDFAATLDSVRERKEAEPANTDPQAASPDPQVATLAADLAATLTASEATEVPTATTTDPATEPAAVAAAAAVAAQVVTAQPPGQAKLVAAQLRPESRVAAQWTAPAGLDAASNSRATTNAASGKPAAESRFEGSARDQQAASQDFKLPQTMLPGKAADALAPGPDAGRGSADSAGSTVSTAADQAASAATTRAHEAKGGALQLDTRLPLHSPRFGEALSQQVLVLSQHGIQQAQMTLNPPELGPIDVRITVENDQASVQIAAASGVARDVIQDALPKLREMMDSSGVRLNDAGVFAQLPQRDQSAPQGQAQRQEWQFNQPAGLRRNLPEDTSFAPRVVRQVGLIDAYA